MGETNQSPITNFFLYLNTFLFSSSHILFNLNSYLIVMLSPTLESRNIQHSKPMKPSSKPPDCHTHPICSPEKDVHDNPTSSPTLILRTYLPFAHSSSTILPPSHTWLHLLNIILFILLLFFTPSPTVFSLCFLYILVTSQRCIPFFLALPLSGDEVTSLISFSFSDVYQRGEKREEGVYALAPRSMYSRGVHQKLG